MKKKLVIFIICALTLMACGKEEKQQEIIDFGSNITSDNANDSLMNEANTENLSFSDDVDNSENIVSIQNELAEIENKSLEFENANWDSMPQQEMNYTTGQWYQLWDDELNSLWSRLTEELDAEAKEQILEEQREWIKLKEKNVKSAGEEVMGGSLQPQLENTVAKSMTRARVYVLAGYLAELKGETFVIFDDIKASLDAENPTVDKTFEHFAGLWPVFDSEESVLAIQRYEDSDYYETGDFPEDVKWIVWYTHGGIMTDLDVAYHTADSITFKVSGGYFRIFENMAGELELWYGNSEDALELVFTADASLY